jgi:Asp-tRNA(Asn)/Glu-tRNA(Gln) amidotransferase A subunit family amidase
MAGVALVASVLCTNWQGIPDVNKPVLGVPDGPYLDSVDVDGRHHFETTCARLQDAGYTIKRIPAMADFEDIDRHHRALVAAEAAQAHQDWYDAYLEHYQDKTKELIEAGKQVSDDMLEQCLAGCWELKEELSHLMKQHQIDLWISPSAPGAAPYGLEATGSPVMNLPWNHARVPVISLPSGKNEDGLPMGLQLAADWDQDELLIGWARYLEETLASI